MVGNKFSLDCSQVSLTTPGGRISVLSQILKPSIMGPNKTGNDLDCIVDK
jgi:hypothetical protein